MAIRGAGGTEGGIGQFFLGLTMTGVGVTMFLHRVNVMSNFGSLFGGHAGLILVPLAVGLALLFFNAKSLLGWLLTVGSLGAVLLDLVSNLTLFFAPTSFFATVGMLTLIASGFVMMVRSLRAAT
jgi:uncharacterized protein